MSKKKNDFSIEKEIEKAKQNLISLYLNIKKGNNNYEINIYNKNNCKSEKIIKKEKNKLENLSILELIEYIKLAINQLISIKVEEEVKKIKNELSDKSENQYISWKYEELLIKEEASLREHIRYEQQLKLECERLNDIIMETKFKNNKKEEKNVI